MGCIDYPQNSKKFSLYLPHRIELLLLLSACLVQDFLEVPDSYRLFEDLLPGKVYLSTMIVFNNCSSTFSTLPFGTGSRLLSLETMFERLDVARRALREVSELQSANVKDIFPYRRQQHILAKSKG
jgi:hypothetical protein